MISINVKGESVNTLKKSYSRTTANWFGICPVCQRPFQHYGFYLRETPHVIGPVAIQRVYCAHCNVSHALLPCFIIPYARVMDVVIEAAIAGICFQTHTTEELAELMGVDPTTVARWWRIFRIKAGALMMALAKELAQSPQLSDWASGSIRTVHDEGRKILELIGRCRATYSPGSAFCGFAWVNILDPYLLFERKNSDKLSGVVSAG